MAIRLAARPHRVTVIRRVAGALDRHGNPAREELTGETLRVRVDPETADETLGLEQREETRYIIIAGAEADGAIVAGDAVLWLERDGLELEVFGPPEPLYDGVGRLHHLEITARRITGG